VIESRMIEGAFGAPVASACVEFIVLLAIGIAVCGLLARPRRWSAHLGALAVMGVCGAWMGMEFAHLFGQAEWDAPKGLAAASFGAVGLAYLWRRLHPPPASDGGGDIAIHRSHA
jgi:hypothetical protein